MIVSDEHDLDRCTWSALGALEDGLLRNIRKKRLWDSGIFPNFPSRVRTLYRFRRSPVKSEIPAPEGQFLKVEPG